jgi:hypothetical protein
MIHPCLKKKKKKKKELKLYGEGNVQITFLVLYEDLVVRENGF